MKITWIVQNLILIIFHMMVFATKKFKTDKTSKNNTFPSMIGLRMTMNVHMWSKLSFNAHYQWLEHPRKPVDSQHLVGGCESKFQHYTTPYNLTIKEPSLCLGGSSINRCNEPSWVCSQEGAIQKNLFKIFYFSQKKHDRDGGTLLLEVFHIDSSG